MARNNKSRRQRKAARRAKNGRRRKNEIQTPDDVFQHGPLRISRYGNVNLFQNLATPEQQVEIRQHLGERFDRVCQGISSQVAQCCKVVSAVDPVQLMSRCYWHWCMLSLDAPAEESKQSHERNEAFQLLEYVQKLICAVGPTTEVPNVTDEQFAELTSATHSIFNSLHLDYFVCRSGRLHDRADYDAELDEYAVRNEMMWLSVRGNRYLSHEAEYFRKVLSPQSGLLERTYGICANAVASGIQSILSSLTKGVFSVVEELDAFRRDTLNAINQDRLLAKMSPPHAMDAVIQRNGWEDRRDSIFGRFLGRDLFDVEKVTGWPTDFIQDLSLAPGEDVAFADGNSESAWPTKFSLTHFAPFLRCHSRSYCFNVYGLTDRLYRAIERGVRNRHARDSECWNRYQKRASEDLVAELFSRLLPGANTYLDAHYWTDAQTTVETKWTDCDLIVVYERQLFVVEVKAGRYTHKPPNKHIRDHLKSLKELIEKAAAQANRFLDELLRHEELTIYTAKRDPLATLRHQDFDQVTRCCISLDQIDDVASRSEDLARLGIDIGPHPVWTVSINDLLVIADVLRNPLIFIDYLRERLRAFVSPACHVSDELDHLGLYLEHNRYTMQAEKLSPAEVMGWVGYRDVFDRFYSDKWAGRRGKIPSQAIPRWMEQALDLLAHSLKPGRVRVAGYLLSLSGETRDEIGNQIARVRNLQYRQNRPRPLSSGGDVRLTVAISQKGAYQTDFSSARDHAISVMTLQGEQDRLALWLQYSEDEVLEDIKWAFLTTADASAVSAKTLAERVQRLEASRTTLKAHDTFRF
ncbi:MAG: hypothetical protein LLG00_12270 [Planctomycetaceae bacterium]|nr:hypothetical protein [Planctomycetaceae bacterium]